MPVPAVVISVGKAVGAAALTIASTKVIPKVIDVLSDKVDDAHEMKKSWIKVPHVAGAKLSEAQSLITTIGLNSLPIEVNANMAFRKRKADTIISQSHKADIKVDPTTTINLYYITQDTIDESQRLFDDREALKIKHKEERHEKIEEIRRRTKESLRRVPIKNKENGFNGK